MTAIATTVRTGLGVLLATVVGAGPVGAASSAASSAPWPSPERQPASVSDGVVVRTLLGPLADDPLSNEDGEFLSTEVVDVVAGGPGFVAVGSAPRGAVVWTSVDGVAWERVTDGPEFDEGRIAAVTVGGPGLVAVGSIRSAAAAWTSPDGLAWQRVRDGDFVTRGVGRTRDTRYPTAMTDVTQLADGSLLAVGWSHGLGCGCGASPGGGSILLASHRVLSVGDLGFIAWRSRDGDRWERLGRIGRSAYGGASSLAPFGRGFVAFGWDRDVFLSSDGRRWRRARIPARLVSAGSRDGRLLAVGAKRGRDPSSIWVSHDGVRWQELGPALPAGTTAVKAGMRSDGAIIALGARNDDEGEPSVWVLPHDAGAWTEMKAPLLADADIADTAADGVRTVMVGTLRRDESEPLPVAWVLPPGPNVGDSGQAPSRVPWVEPLVPHWTPFEGVDARSEAASVRLADGRILVAGGDDATDERVLTAELLDIEAGTVTRATDLPTSISGGAAARGIDGSVYLIGWMRGGIGLRYDPTDGSWARLKGRIADLWRPTVATMADGRLLVSPDLLYQSSLSLVDPRTGRVERKPIDFARIRLLSTTDGRTIGFSSSRAWRFDPATGWTPGAPSPHLLEGTHAHLVPVALADGRVAILASGVRGPDGAHTMLDLYDPVTDTWTLGAALPQLRYGFTAVQVPDGRLLVIGGYGASLPPAILVDVP